MKWTVSLLFVLPQKRFPFDSNNAIGYLIAVILEYVFASYEYFVIACTLALGIGAFWVAMSLTKEIKRIVHSINHKTKAKMSQSHELMHLFLEFVDAHAAVKQLSIYINLSMKYVRMCCGEVCIKNITAHLYFLVPAHRLFCLQNGKWFFERISTNNHVTVHMESFSHFGWYANYSSGHSWVHFLSFLNDWLARSFSKFLNFSSISVGSWKCYTFMANHFKWYSCIGFGVHCMWAWPKDERRTRWNQFHCRSVPLVFVSHWN